MFREGMGFVQQGIEAKPIHAVPGPVLGAGLPGVIIGLLATFGLIGIYWLVPAIENEKGKTF